MSKSHEVFISYHWRDHEEVVAIAQALRREQGIDAFLDRWYLTPGQPGNKNYKKR